MSSFFQLEPLKVGAPGGGADAPFQILEGCAMIYQQTKPLGSPFGRRKTARAARPCEWSSTRWLTPGLWSKPSTTPAAIGAALYSTGTKSVMIGNSSIDS